MLIVKDKPKWGSGIYSPAFKRIEEMKVKDLIEALKGLEDYDVETNFWGHELENYTSLGVHTFELKGITDVGVSDKVVILNFNPDID